MRHTDTQYYSPFVEISHDYSDFLVFSSAMVIYLSVIIKTSQNLTFSSNTVTFSSNTGAILIFIFAFVDISSYSNFPIISSVEVIYLSNVIKTSQNSVVTFYSDTLRFSATSQHIDTLYLSWLLSL